MSRIIIKPLPAKTGERPMLKSGQLQARLGVSYSTLWRMRQEGRGPTAYRVGREWRYEADDVDRWLASQEKAGGAL